ncbi:hypothetical protein KS670_003365 [Vibrio parahaemolyticus]|uniref:hypothetical protein n=1 Tax=Vibrio sp. B183 TaxID=1526762 RepID=UPI0005066134|nr:hypothetical protein [Vibrio sp. B183]EHR0227805.1 hypothetical protein [Vibrio parahaemolyticus]KFI12683.1 hypothetical protein IX95_06945 [Vibrio sp. B183]
MNKQNHKNLTLGINEVLVKIPVELKDLFLTYFFDAQESTVAGFNYTLPVNYLNRLNQFLNEVDGIINHLEEEKTKLLTNDELKNIRTISTTLIHEIAHAKLSVKKEV